MKKKAYTIETDDIIIPLTERLGNIYVVTDPHPIVIFEKVGNMALAASLGQSRQIPILDVLNQITVYQGREGFNDIANDMVRLWARLFYFIDPLRDELYDTSLNIISISGGDLRIVFDDINEDTSHDKPSI